MSIDNVKCLTATNHTRTFKALHPELNDNIRTLASIWDSIVKLSVRLSIAEETRMMPVEDRFRMWENIHEFEQLIGDAVPIAYPLAYSLVMTAAQDVEQTDAPTDNVEWFLFKRDKLGMDDIDWPEDAD